MRWIGIGITLLLLTACHLLEQPKTAMTIDMYSQTGDLAGTAKLSENPDGVKVKLKVEGLTPGYHGLHLHEKAVCESPDFRSAGNHFNPEDKEHGLLNPKGPHVGDLKNIEADKDGKVDTEVTAEGTTLLKGKNKSLTKKDGTSLIITSEADDGMSQVSGDSGERIICGEIKENEDKK